MAIPGVWKSNSFPKFSSGVFSEVSSVPQVFIFLLSYVRKLLLYLNIFFLSFLRSWEIHFFYLVSMSWSSPQSISKYSKKTGLVHSKSRWYFQIRALSHASGFSFCNQMVQPVRLISNIFIGLIKMIRTIFRFARSLSRLSLRGSKMQDLSSKAFLIFLSSKRIDCWMCILVAGSR